MLRFDIRALRGGATATEATVEPGDPVLHGLDVRFEGPVRVAGSLQAAGSGTFRWTGRLEGAVRGECRRCLAELVSQFEAPVEAVFTTSPEAADDPGVHLLAEPVTVIDLSDAVREEVALAVPAYPLCREQCAGLCPTCGADLNQGPCQCARPVT
jgi:uncharacterized protein